MPLEFIHMVKKLSETTNELTTAIRKNAQTRWGKIRKR
jgi:hypothetical protein